MKQSNSNVYQLFIGFTNKGLYYVKSDRREFNEYRFYNGEWIENWPEDISFIFDGEPEGDFLMGGLHWRLVSERVRQVFIQNKIPGVQFLPVKVIHNQTGKELGPYYVLNILQSAVGQNRTSIQNLDFFRRITDVFISERLKRQLEQEHASSGASFQRVPLLIFGIKE